MIRIISLLLIFTSIVHTQTYNVKGYVTDASNDEPLSFVNVLIAGTTSGTSANDEGIFNLKLKRGQYKLVFSFIGYQSDTLHILVPTSQTLHIELKAQPIKLADVVVTGEDPAYRIIREAIKRKKENREGLNNFEYNSYSKRIITSAGEVAMIEEVFLKGFNKINEWEKEFILSTHKTENLKREVRTMDFNINDKYYIDFWSDTLSLLMNRVYLPIAENAFDHYDYKLLETIEGNKSETYRIQVIPKSSIQPLLMGEITVDSENYAMNSVNLKANEGIRFPFVNNLSLEFIQQLDKYDGFWLPNYVESKAKLEVSFQGLLNIEEMSFNQFSNITDYKLNGEIPDSIANAVRSKFGYFTPDTSGNEIKPPTLSRIEIDSIRTLPLSRVEIKAYEELDSTKTMDKMVKVSGALAALIPDEEDDDTTTGFFSTALGTLGKYGYFRNNRTTGVVLGARYDDSLFTKELDLNAFTGYSFDREVVEGKLSLRYKFNESLIDYLELSGFNYSKTWQTITPYPDIANSFAVTFGFEDHFNYYLSRGYSFSIGKKFGDFLSTDLSFISENIESLPTNNYRSFINTKRKPRVNPAVKEGFDNKISLDLQVGFNPYEIQITPRNGLVANATYSVPGLSSDFDYTKFRLTGLLTSKTFYDELFVSPYMQLIVDASTVSGNYGPQHLITPQSSLSIYAPAGVMKGLKPYEFIGTEMISVQFEHNWRTIIFQSLGLDFLSDLHIDIITGAGAARTWNNSSYFPTNKMDEPYWESYISISRIFAALRVDVVYNSQKEWTARAGIGTLF
jgi:hypothetical protein